MGVLEGFMATWTKAYDQYGEGAPPSGAHFDQSSQLRSLQGQVELAAPGSRWTGGAAAAYGKVNSDHEKVFGGLADLDQRLGSKVDHAGDIVTTGRQNLNALKKRVTDAAAAVPPGKNRDQLLLPIVSNGLGQLQDIVKDSNGKLNGVANDIKMLSGEYDKLGKQKFAPKEGPDFENIKGDEEKKQEDLAKRAQQDVKASLDGDKNAIQRVAGVLNGISNEQQAGQPKLNAEQQAYLSQMQAQQKLRSVDQLKAAADKGAKGIMADSMQLMSNPKLEFPKTESVDGALQGSETVKGGFNQLPSSVQDTIKSPGIHEHQNLQKIADIVNGGNGSHFQHDTDLDRGLVHKVADMMEDPKWRTADGHTDPNSMFYDGSIPHAELEPIAQDVMNAVHNDHQVVHDAITGKVEPGNEFRDQFKVNSDHLMYNLTHEAWDDKGASAGSLFDWTKGSATGPEGVIAAETAHAYGDYIGRNSHDLMHLKDSTTIGLSGNHTLGDVNPALTYAMAQGLSPYINEMAGLADPRPGYGLFDPNEEMDTGKMPDTKGVFAVLNGDEHTAKYWNSEVYQQVLLHETEFARHPSNSAYDQDLLASATLRGLTDAGTHTSFEAHKENNHAIDMHEYEWKKQGYQLGLEVLKSGGAALPGAGPYISGPLVSGVGAALQDSIIHPPDPPAPNQPITSITAQAANERILRAMVAVGADVPIPQGHRDDDGNVVAPPGANIFILDGQLARAQDANPMEYQAALGAAASAVLGNNALGGRSAIQGMMDWYGAITSNPDPNHR